MGMVVTILLVVTALALHLTMDFHKQTVHRPIIHWLSAVLVLSVSLGLGIANQFLEKEHWYAVTLLSLSIHFSLFDPIWNKLNGHGLFYFGTVGNPSRAWIDRILSKFSEENQLLIKFFVLLVGLILYLKLR